MKKVLFGLPLFLLAACAGSNNQDSTGETTIGKSDTLVEVDSMAVNATSEEAADESIEENKSTEPDNEAFLKVLPTPALAIGTDNWAETVGSKLKALGYSGSTQKKKDKEISQMNDMDFYNTVGNYEIKVGDKSCVIKFEECPHLEFGFIQSSITVNGDNEALNNLYTQISKYVHKKGWGNVADKNPVTKKGNTIKIYIDYYDDDDE